LRFPGFATCSVLSSFEMLWRLLRDPTGQLIRNNSAPCRVTVSTVTLHCLYSAAQDIAVQYGTVQYSTIQCSTALYCAVFQLTVVELVRVPPGRLKRKASDTVEVHREAIGRKVSRARGR